MNPVIENIMDRRTIRKYTDQPVTDETMQELYKVIESTQSWANTQCWEIVDVRDPALRKQLQSALPGKNPSHKAIAEAPKLLAVCARKGRSGLIDDKIANKHGDWYMYDLGLMTQNLCLAAHSLGLGTVVVGWYDLEAAEGILNCPDDVEVVTLIPMGYRAQKGHVPPHRPVSEFVHTNTF